ncbi:hypothetical protein AVEN_167507-1 [Araneus ventricosus]|uniref:Uncharacterized protein n=1 Tax=Araneus ventricosus TaxID=182803 RepID=A0A4Y2P833_ARAVE|nr:hypothetical protein AVEN_237572-1 [Araneus ventricosus]GBN47201.1 hypothetical protein AVEN_34121-1 [Araneus ventricosus]GBN47219.1 hypothetical protein AVEN_87329-1 [Araneus ventricosus]GBN47239.1 hypothetical protein AVEN_167507-1 [Araneus ventricosus]
MENAVTTWLNELAAEKYDMGILKLVDRYDKCLNVGACQVTSGQRASCSRDRMRQCDDSLLRSIQRRVNDMSRSDMSAHCM